MWSLLSSEKLCDNVDNVTINPVCNCHFRLYYNIFKRSYGELSGDTMLTSLQASLDAYNKKEGAECGKMFADSKNIIIALCSPLMRRVHSMIPESAEMVFVDSSGNCDRTNSRVFLLLTHSAIGGLPLGVMITSSESQSVITAGLQLLKSILPEDAFFRRGDLGPQVAMTDDCQALRQALSESYPHTHPILCVFHILQAMWRWLWDAHNAVPKSDRQTLLQLFKAMVYARNPGELEASYHRALEDSTAKLHPRYCKYLTSIFSRREAWAICLRTHLPTRGNDTNNYVESAMRVLKDQVLYRLKAYNITQLMDFITTRLEAYYCRRLIDAANNRIKLKSKGDTRRTHVWNCYMVYYCHLILICCMLWFKKKNYVMSPLMWNCRRMRWTSWLIPNSCRTKTGNSHQLPGRHFMKLPQV